MACELNDLFSVPQDSSYHTQEARRMSEFYFGHGLDMIEEDALNEKFCVQVLRILITKADNEIDELEKALVFLQSELAWAEYDDWPEICCNALRKKFDCLCLKVRNLKNKGKDWIDVSLLTPRRPAEKLHEIVKALLEDYLQERDKQLLDGAGLDTSSPPGHAAGVLEESIKFNNCDSCIIVKEEIPESSTTTTENGAIIKKSLLLHKKKINHPDRDKPPGIHVKYSSRNSLKHADSYSTKKKSLRTSDTIISGVEEDSYSQKKKSLRTSNTTTTSEGAEKDSSTSGANVTIFNSSLKPSETRKNLGETVMSVNVVFKDSDSNACRHEAGLDNERTTKGKSDSEVCRNEEVRTFHTTSSGVIEILKSSSYPEGKGIPSKAEEPANSILQTISNDALSNSNGLRGRRNNSDSMLYSSVQAKCGNSNIILDALKQKYGLKGSRNNSDFRLAVSRVEKGGNPDVSIDVLQHTTDPTARQSNSDSVLASLGQFKVGNCDSSLTMRHTSGLNQRRNHSDSSLGTFREGKGRYCDIDKEHCDFAKKALRNCHTKESNIIMTHNIDSSYLSSKVEEGKRKSCQNIVKLEIADPTDNEPSAIASLFELQDKKGKDITKTEPDEGKMQLEEVQRDENAAPNEKFNLGLSVKPPKPNAKRKTGSSPSNDQESEMLPSSSLISKAKRQWKSGPPSDRSSSNQHLDRETMKKIVCHHQCEAQEPSTDLDDSQILVSRSKEKRKRNSTLPTLMEIKGSTFKMDLSHGYLIDTAGKDGFLITKSNSIDSCTEAVSSSSFLISKLENMKVGDLRTIAKEKKLRKYSKLRKSVLIDRIVKHLGYC